MKLIIAVFVLLAVQQTLAQYKPGTLEKIKALNSMRQSLYQSLKDQSTVLRSNRFVFEGRCDLMSHGLNSLVSDPSVTDKNKKALLNLDSLVKKQFAPIISLITSNDVALNQTVKDKLDELQPVLESVYILIDTIYTAQMKQTVDLSYKAAYCATSLETQVLQIWMKKMEEFYSIFEYQSSNKIMVNFNQNPNFIAFWNLSETFTAQMNTCDTPTTKCVNGLISLFPTGNNTTLALLKNSVASEVSRVRNSTRVALNGTIKIGLLQADALKKSVAGCVNYFST